MCLPVKDRARGVDVTGGAEEGDLSSSSGLQDLEVGCARCGTVATIALDAWPDAAGLYYCCE